MRISVALSAYNGVKHLAGQLDSILSQTRVPDQIVIRNDGSTDSTLPLLEQYHAKYPDLIVIVDDGKRLGCDRSFMECFKHTDGDVIFPCDQDDIWFPEKVETMLKYFDENTDFVYAQDVDYYDETDVMVPSAVKLPPLYRAVWYCYLKGHTCAFRRAILPIFDFQGLMTWDYYLQMYAICSGRYKECPQELMYWRRHSSSQTMHSEYTNKRLGKWQMCVSSIEKLRKGYKSDCIERRFNDRGSYMLFLMDMHLVNDSSKRSMMATSKILLNVSRQTVCSMLKATFLHTLNVVRSESLKTMKPRRKVAFLLCEMRYPLTFYYMESDKRYL